MRALALLVVPVVLCGIPARARAQVAVPYEMFTGEVSYGQDFEVDFGGGLSFRLAASRDPMIPGWTIEVHGTDGVNGDVELSSVVTPPYRFWNPRYLDLSYGYSAAEVVAIDVRAFSFLRDPSDYTASFEALGKVLWPNGLAEEEVARARAFLEAVPKCSGVLRILDDRILVDPETSKDRLDWLKFGVELCPGAERVD